MPLWRDANRLLLLIETSVKQFPRYHKYTLGGDLRRQAMVICRLIGRAVHDRPGRANHLKRLVFAVDDIKVMIQLGKELKAFPNFKVFEAAAKLAVELGRQSGGWLRRTTASP